MELSEKLKIINRELELEKNILMSNIEENKKYIQLLEQENQELRESLDKIIYSRSYKMMQKIKRIIKRGQRIE